MSGNQDLSIQKIDKLTSNSTTNKVLYIVVVEDPTVEAHSRSYLSMRVDQMTMAAEMLGFEITKPRIIAQLENVVNYNDAIELVKKHNAVQESLISPWHRIIRIRKLKFNVTKSA
jgi:hypothetical protein